MLRRALCARARALAISGCLAVSTLGAQVPSSGRTVNGETVALLVPTGTVSAQAMEIAAPARFTELTAKLQAAARKDPAWFEKHVRAGRPGEPLAYDARMGMPEGEYREMLALADSMMLRPVSTVELRVLSTPSGWRIEGSATVPSLHDVEIDTVAWEVRTPFGGATNVKAITANPGQRTTGPWDGVQWQREDASLATGSGTIVTFAIGRLVRSGRGLLYYDAKRAADGALAARVTHILTFDLPR